MHLLQIHINDIHIALHINLININFNLILFADDTVSEPYINVYY